LGSGCTYTAIEVAAQAGYFYYSLSQPIHGEAERQGIKHPSYDDLQSIGNDFRVKHGPSALAMFAVGSADAEWAKNPLLKGIVVDGIRNAGEEDYFRQFPNFFMFSIQATADCRFERLRKLKRVKTREEFDAADKRDANEKWVQGQQVKECTYRADIVFNNEHNIPKVATDQKYQYIRDKFMRSYVSLIQRVLAHEPTYEHQPAENETLMAMAYCTSKRSRCEKRKVGAVIANQYGNVISAGYNDVPEGVLPCILDPAINGCYRDRLQEEFAATIHNCPVCGRKITGKFRCIACGKILTAFVKRCDGCGRDPEIEYTCKKCTANVYEEFVPGAQPAMGKLLDMCRSLHAEEKALLGLTCDASGIPANGTLFTTTFPCNLCANKIVAAGIKKVVFAEPYPMPEAMAVLQNSGVELINFQGVKSSAYFRLYR
jgi:deoxycytidylate deaminase